MNYREQIEQSGYNIPYSQDVSVLGQPLQLSKHCLQNRLAIQPMEGCDGTAEGAFGELTHRRYERFAQSGAALIWMEAVAITQEGRANPRQLFLNDQTLDAFKSELECIRETAQKTTGVNPILIMQATHSGRYSKPNGKPAPLIAGNKPVYEGEHPLDASCIVSDDYLEALEEKYEHSAYLAQCAGFDGVDIKCCHGYLMNELMSARLRPGKYGGSLENRTRLFYNAIERAKAATSSTFMVTSRMNVYDGFAYPYGFGVSENGGLTPDLREPLQVVDTLHNRFGFSLLDITIGNPYVNPHVNRPFAHGPYVSPENPLVGVERMMHCVGEIQKAFPNLAVIGSGFSYLGKESGNLAAGAVKNGICKIAGFGREAFAYPDFAKDLLAGGMNEKRVCLACGKCSEMMRAGGVAGCVIRDSAVYMPSYQKYCGKQGGK